MDSLPLVALDEVDSTIAEAERRVEAGARAPFVVTAKSQTGGHGRFGRTWASPPGNLYWTIALDRQASWPADQGLTFAAGLAVGDALAAIGIEPAHLSLKWP